MTTAQVRFVTGVYQWRNTANGKVYIGGASISFRVRKGGHTHALRRGIHCNRHLQSAWNYYGEKAFVFEVIERCSAESVLECEQKWLDKINPTDPKIGYNICGIAGNCAGVRQSDETKKKRGQALRDKFDNDPEYRQKVLLKNKGRVHTAETRAKFSEAGKKRLSDPEERRKASEQAMRPEVRAKKSAAAKKQWESEEHRADIAVKNRAANQRQFADPEKRAKHKAAVEAWAIRTYGSVEAWKEFTRERNRTMAASRKAKQEADGHG